MHTKNYPECFPSLRHYQQWVKAALTAKEDASPCDDCSAEFMTDMVFDRRCFSATVRTTFNVAAKPPAKS